MIPKFRAWLKKEQKMDNYIDHISWLEDELYCIGDGITYMVSAEDLVLMQSTGLVDKNGKEIFDGDIVQFEDCYTETDFLYVNTGIVEWSQGSFTITNRDSVEMGDLLDGEFLDVTIIGNVYENPELLEDKE